MGMMGGLVGCLSTICLVLGSYYASIVSRIYTSSSWKKGAASDLNGLEELEFPDMVFAGSREAQKRVKLGQGKWQKHSKNCWLPSSKWAWRNYEHITMATQKIREKITKVPFCSVRQTDMYERTGDYNFRKFVLKLSLWLCLLSVGGKFWVHHATMYHFWLNQICLIKLP